MPKYLLSPDLGDAEGLKFYGARYDSPTIKGRGWFGQLPEQEGNVATELSAYAPEIGDFPLITPTTDKKQLAALLRGVEPDEETIINAENWAKARQARGLSPFAQSDELTLRNVQGINPDRLKGFY